jgi:hypothetical protein
MHTQAYSSAASVENWENRQTRKDMLSKQANEADKGHQIRAIRMQSECDRLSIFLLHIAVMFSVAIVVIAVDQEHLGKQG